MLNVISLTLEVAVEVGRVDHSLYREPYARMNRLGHIDLRVHDAGKPADATGDR